MIFLGLIFLITIGIASVVMKSKRELIKEKLTKFKKNFFFNGLIKSLNYSYLPFCISISVTIQSMDAEEHSVTSTIIHFLLLLVCFIIPLVMANHSLKKSTEFQILQKEDGFSNVKGLF